MKINELPTPCYVIDEAKLIKNLKILHGIEERTGARILLAQKCFSGFHWYPIIRDYLSGTTASGLYEAILGKEEMGKENHVFSPAYRPQDLEELSLICDHIIFNSRSQLERFGSYVKKIAADHGKELSLGLRINPACSTQEGHAIYDPCAPGSRMGTLLEDLQKFDDELLEMIDGIHFHTLCEQNSDDLEKTLIAVEENFAPYLRKIKWLNIGGGHHITREDYDIDRLERLICHMRDRYELQIYIEPGEAVALNAGYNVTQVLDIMENNGKILILDTSAACHMPDVLEMPYRPPLKNSGHPGEKAYTYRLAGNTCLAGDVIGEYSFDQEIRVGDYLYFEDMAIYSMVKNNTFNGVPLPCIASMNQEGDCQIVKEFDYEDFKQRLS